MHQRNQLNKISILILFTALTCLLIVAISPAPTTIRIIAASAGATTCVILGIMYYVTRRGRHGK